MSLDAARITPEKISQNGVVAAPDILSGTPQENKAIFDRLVGDVVADSVNEIIDNVEAMQDVGPYDPSKQYRRYNRAIWDGSSYECLQDCVGISPPNETYWLLTAARGTDGDGAGDMRGNVYDPQGIRRDIYDYALPREGNDLWFELPVGAGSTLAAGDIAAVSNGVAYRPGLCPATSYRSETIAPRPASTNSGYSGALPDGRYVYSAEVWSGSSNGGLRLCQIDRVTRTVVKQSPPVSISGGGPSVYGIRKISAGFLVMSVSSGKTGTSVHVVDENLESITRVVLTNGNATELTQMADGSCVLIDNYSWYISGDGPYSQTSYTSISTAGVLEKEEGILWGGRNVSIGGRAAFELGANTLYVPCGEAGKWKLMKIVNYKTSPVISALGFSQEITTFFAALKQADGTYGLLGAMADGTKKWYELTPSGALTEKTVPAGLAAMPNDARMTNQGPDGSVSYYSNSVYKRLKPDFSGVAAAYAAPTSGATCFPSANRPEGTLQIYASGASGLVCSTVNAVHPDTTFHYVTAAENGRVRLTRQQITGAAAGFIGGAKIYIDPVDETPNNVSGLGPVAVRVADGLYAWLPFVDFTPDYPSLSAEALAGMMQGTVVSALSGRILELERTVSQLSEALDALTEV